MPSMGKEMRGGTTEFWMVLTEQVFGNEYRKAMISS